MRIIDILNPAEIKEFENPPLFSYQQRKVFFEIPVGLKSKLNEFVSPVNDVGLVTQMGYFRACGRFFRLNTFCNSDLARFGFEDQSTDSELLILQNQNRLIES